MSKINTQSPILCSCEISGEVAPSPGLQLGANPELASPEDAKSVDRLAITAPDPWRFAPAQNEVQEAPQASGPTIPMEKKLMSLLTASLLSDGGEFHVCTQTLPRVVSEMAISGQQRA